MPDSTPAWDDNLLQNPHAVADKRRRVQQMFAAIAPKYDLNNRLHSLGRDQAWRRRAVEIAELKIDDRVVDVACGTGDLSFAFAKHLGEFNGGFTRYNDAADDWIPRPVLAIDYTFPMLVVGQSKMYMWGRGSFRSRKTGTILLGDGYSPSVQFLNGDAQALPLPDASADVVSIAFGIRNVQDVNAALREFHRVLRPGGRVIILEFSRPRNRVIRFFNDLYCAKIMPHTATWISGDKSGAYKYLPKSVESFIDREQMMAKMRDSGFGQVEPFPMTFGVCVCYRGVK